MRPQTRETILAVLDGPDLIPDALREAGYQVSVTHSVQEGFEAARRVLEGGKYISPTLAQRMAEYLAGPPDTARALRKLGLRTTAELIHYAVQHKLVD